MYEQVLDRRVEVDMRVEGDEALGDTRQLGVFSAFLAGVDLDGFGRSGRVAR